MFRKLLKHWKYYVLLYAVVPIFCYWIVAGITFQLRHPWATEVEQLIHIKDVFTFQKIPYKEMRER